jgi:alpha-1,6-mannosyltransferase
MHIVDATLFFSPTSGGVKRYLLAKHEWMRAHTSWRHSLVVPGEISTYAPGDISMVAGGRVPGAFNYRLPLNPLRWSRAIEALQPDLIEVGDAFHPAWAASRVAGRRGIPLVAFFHSNFPQLAGRRLGATVQKIIERYVRLTYSRFDQVFAPSRFTCDYLHRIGVGHATWQPLGVDIDVFHPSRGGRDLVGELGLPRGTRLLVYAGRFSTEKNLPLLTAAFRRLGAPYHLLLIGGDESRRDGNVTPSASWCSRPWPAAGRWSPWAPARCQNWWRRTPACSPNPTPMRRAPRGTSPRPWPRCTGAISRRSAPRRGATSNPTTAGRGRCRG